MNWFAGSMRLVMSHCLASISIEVAGIWIAMGLIS